MSPETVINLVQQGMQVALLVSAPMLLTALVTGLVVSIFQAATQINEATLTFLPKLIVVAVILWLAGPWMLGQLITFTRTVFLALPGAAQ